MLLLAARELCPALTPKGVAAIVELHDEVVCVGHLSRSDDLIVCDARFSIADVLADGCFEEGWLCITMPTCEQYFLRLRDLVIAPVNVCPPKALL